MERLAAAIPELAQTEILKTDHADYRFRIVVDWALWRDVILPKFADIGYGNFKAHVDSVFGVGDVYSRFLHRLWAEVRDALGR